MINKDLVSIAMTTYNGERFLQQQLDSIINQTYSNVEIIIVDDYSTDQTKEILVKFQKEYAYCVKVYFKRFNLGLVKNFEKAIGYCNGNYIALADQDDVWRVEKIEKLVSLIGNKSLIYSDVSLIDNEGKTFRKSRASTYGINNKSGLSFCDLVFKNYVIGCSALFKKDMIRYILPIPENSAFHDWWIATVASKESGIEYCNEPLVGYRQHENNQYGDKNKSFFKKISSYIYKNDEKTYEYEWKKKRLETMRNNSLFTKTDRENIDMAIKYYESFLKSKFLFYYWYLTIKYFRLISTKNKI